MAVDGDDCLRRVGLVGACRVEIKRVLEEVAAPVAVEILVGLYILNCTDAVVRIGVDNLLFPSVGHIVGVGVGVVDSDGYCGRIRMQFAVEGGVGEAVGAVESWLGCIVERAVMLEGQVTVGWLGLEDGGDHLRVGIGIVDEHAGSCDVQSGVLNG